MEGSSGSEHAAWNAARRHVSGIWEEFKRNNGPQAAAAFAFFCFLSLLALLFFSGAVLGMLLKDNQQLLQRILDYISKNTPGLTDTISEALQASIRMRGVLSIGGALGLLYTSTKVADSLQIWLCGMWGVDAPGFLRRKAKSLAILVFIGLMIALGFGVHVALLLAGRWYSWLNLFAGAFAFALSTSILFAVALFIYSYAVEEARPGWRSAWKGALFAALLVNPVQLLLTWYYSNLGDYSAVYGSFAGVVLTVIIIYYTGYIIFLGATLNRYLENLSRPPGEGSERLCAGDGDA